MKKTVLIIALVGFFNFASAQWLSTGGPGIASVSPMVGIGTDLYIGSALKAIYVLRDGVLPWTSCGFTNAVNVLATDGTTLYAGIAQGTTPIDGIYKSTDNGATWTPTGLSGEAVFSILVKGTYIFAGTNTNGVFRSADNGATWTAINNGIALNVQALAISGTTLFAGTNGGSGAYISTDNGDTWIGKNSGLPTTKNVRSLAVMGTTVIAGTWSGAFITSNNGETWTASNSGLSRLRIQSMAVDGSTLYAATTDAGIFKTDLSANNITWSTANTDLTSLAINSLTILGVNLYATVVEGSVVNVWKMALPSVATGINNTRSTTQLSVSPTFANDKLTIEISGRTGKQEFNIMNIAGQTVYKSSITEKVTVDVANFKSGIYMVKLDDGKSTVTKKFIKQ